MCKSEKLVATFRLLQSSPLVFYNSAWEGEFTWGSGKKQMIRLATKDLKYVVPSFELILPCYYSEIKGFLPFHHHWLNRI